MGLQLSHTLSDVAVSQETLTIIYLVASDSCVLDTGTRDKNAVRDSRQQSGPRIYSLCYKSMSKLRRFCQENIVGIHSVLADHGLHIVEKI